MPDETNAYFLIEKFFEPEGAYAASLEQLPGEEENLTPGLPEIVKLRAITEAQADMIAARQYIKSVEPNPHRLSSRAGGESTGSREYLRRQGARPDRRR